MSVNLTETRLNRYEQGMWKRCWVFITGISALLLPVLPSAQPVADPATDLAQQLQARVPAGTLQWFESGAGKWLALVEPETTGAPQGGVILLHDSGQHLDSPGVITQFRSSLPQFGWTTVSLYNPVMHRGALTEQNAADALKAAQEAVRAAVQKLSPQGGVNWMLLGYGSGATLAAAILAADPGALRGFIAVSLASSPEADPIRFTPAHLEKIMLPVLDIYGERDQDAVLRSAPARAAAAKQASITAQQQRKADSFQQSAVAENPFSNTTGVIAYRQVVIPGADHLYRGQETLLIKRVVGWLRNHASAAAPAR